MSDVDRILRDAYDWQIHMDNGTVAGLTAGDQGYENTGLTIPELVAYARREGAKEMRERAANLFVTDHPKGPLAHDSIVAAEIRALPLTSAQRDSGT